MTEESFDSFLRNSLALLEASQHEGSALGNYTYAKDRRGLKNGWFSSATPHGEVAGISLRCTSELGGPACEFQQDSVGVYTNTASVVMAVADGMSGVGSPTSGQLAAHALLSHILAEAEYGTRPDIILSVAGQALRKLHEASLEIEGVEMGTRTMGASVAMAAIDKSSVIFSHVGNCRAMLARQSAKGQYEAVHSTQDHSELEEALRDISSALQLSEPARDALRQELRLNYPYRQSLSNFLRIINGRVLPYEVETQEMIGVHARDVFILGTDGLFNALGTAQLLPLLDQNATAKQIAAAIVGAVKSTSQVKSLADNLALVVYKHSLE